MQDSEILKLLEIANIRLAAANETIGLLNDRLAVKDEVIRAKDGVIVVREEQLALAKAALENRTDARAVDLVRIEACQTQLTKADQEINRLRNPSFFRRVFSSESLFGFGLGFATSSISK